MRECASSKHITHTSRRGCAARGSVKRSIQPECPVWNLFAGATLNRGIELALQKPLLNHQPPAMHAHNCNINNGNILISGLVCFFCLLSFTWICPAQVMLEVGTP